MGLTRRQGRQPRAAGKGKGGNKAKGNKKGGAGKGAGAAAAQAGGGGALRKRLAQDVYDYGSEARTRRRRRGDDNEEGEGGVEEYADKGNPQYAYRAGEQEDEEIDEEGAFDSEDERRYGEILRQIEENDERPSAASASRKRGRGEEEGSEEEEDDDDEEGGGMMLSDLLGGGGAEEGSSAAAKAKDPASKKTPHEEDGDSSEEGSSEEESGSDDDEEEEEEEGDSEELMGMVDRLIAAQQAAQAAGANGGANGDFLQAFGDSAFGTLPAEGLTMEAMLGALQDTRGYAAVRKRLATLAEEGQAIAAPAPTTVQKRAERQLTYKEKKKQIGEWLPLVAAARQAESLNFSYEAPVRPSQAALVGKFDPQTEMERAVHDLLVHARADKEAAVEAAEQDDLGARGLTAEQVKVRRAELAKMRALLFYEQQKRHRANKIKSKAYHRIRKRQRLRQEEASREALRAVDPEAAAELDEKEALARAQERMSLRHKNTSKWAKHAQRTQGATAQAETRRALAEQLELGQQLRKKAGAEDSDDESDYEDDDEDAEGLDDRQRAARVKARAAGQIRTLLGEVEGGEEEAQTAKGLMGMKFMARAVERQRARAREEVEAVLRELEHDDDASSSDSSGDDDGGAAAAGKKKRQEQEEGPPPAPVALKEGTLQAAGLAWGAAGAGKAMRVSGPITVAGSANAPVAAEEAGMGLELQAPAAEAAAASAGAAPASFLQERGVATRLQKRREEGGLARLSAATISPSTGLNAAMGGAAAAPGQFEEDEERGEEAVNPWLAPVGGQGAGADGGRKARRGTRATTARMAAAGVIDVERAVAAVAAAEQQPQPKATKAKPASKAKATPAAMPPAEASDASDGEGNGEAVVEGRLVRTAEQAALVQRAFAHADPEGEEFRNEKEALVEAERAEAEAAEAKKKGKKGNLDKNSGVAGWGSWAGAGAAAAPPPPPPAGGGGAASRRRALGGKERASGGGAAAVPVPAAKAVDKGLVKPRMDKDKPTVIINERRVKKAASLKVSEVPYPFTSREQYERAMRRPVGKEWNTALAVRDQTRPAVKVRPGTVVRPIKLRKTHKAVYPGSI